MPIEALLVPWLASTLSARAVTELPSDLQTQVPLLRVTRAGGGAFANLPQFDVPRVAIDSFAVGYGPTADFADAIEAAMRRTLPGKTLGTSVVTKVESVSGPLWVPYADTALRHFVGVYQLHVLNR